MDEIQVVSRNAIPPVQAVEHAGVAHAFGELRDFRWNALLRDFMPASAGLAVSWVRLKHGEVLELRAHAVQALVVVYAGSGEMLGDLERSVSKDDVAIIPAGCRYGFAGGPDDLYALSILLGDTGEPAPAADAVDPQNTFGGLMAYNQERLEEFKRRPLFELLRDGTLSDPVRRRVFVDAIQVWLQSNRALLLARQACCSDPQYAARFLQDLQAGGVAGGALQGAPERDPALAAMSNWFTYQMFVLDNAEKAVVEIASKCACAAYQNVAVALMTEYSHQAYDHVNHAITSADLLRHQSPRTYARLHTIMGEAWDMLSAVTDRIVELTLEV
jgi:hypothetical protein